MERLRDIFGTTPRVTEIPSKGVSDHNAPRCPSPAASSVSGLAASGGGKATDDVHLRIGGMDYFVAPKILAKIGGPLADMQHLPQRSGQASSPPKPIVLEGRHGPSFKHILDFAAHQELAPGLSKDDLEHLLEEADFFVAPDVAVEAGAVYVRREACRQTERARIHPTYTLWLGNALFLVGQVSAARQKWDEAFAQIGTDESLRALTRNALQTLSNRARRPEQGIILWHLAKLADDGEEYLLREAIAINPTFKPAWDELKRVAIRDGSLQVRLDLTARLVEQFPNCAEYWSLRADVYAEWVRYGDAAIAADTEDDYGEFIAAQMLIGGRYDVLDTTPEQKRAVLDAPSPLPKENLWLNKVFLAAQRGVDLSGNSSDSVALYAQILHLLGFFAEAAKMLRDKLGQDPKCHYLYQALANVYLSLELQEEASEILRQGIDATGQHPTLMQMQNRLSDHDDPTAWLNLGQAALGAVWANPADG